MRGSVVANMEEALEALDTLSQPRPAIVMIHHDDPPGAVGFLKEHDVIVDYRPGFVRVSPHFYNTEDEVDRCISLLARFNA